MRCAGLTALLCVTLATSLAQSRLVAPTDSWLHAYRNRHRTHEDPTLPTRIASYFQTGGFPKAGRSLKDKIQAAESFLLREIPKSGIVGVGAAIVYDDQVVLASGYGLRSSKNLGSAVSADSMFQIGSVTKTMIAVAIGLLVDEGKLRWNDPVKAHLPWLTLFDKYAQEHVTIGDMLAMNSGFGGLPDIPMAFGMYDTERAYVEALQFCEPQYSLREQPDYANVNYVILGQLLKSVTGIAWHEFLRERIWKPLGMNNTYASAHEIPESIRHRLLSDGHFVCGDEQIGPLDLVSSPLTQLDPGRVSGYNAAGSVVSSAADMAVFLRLLLNKGRVGNTTLIQSPSVISEMIRGKVSSSPEVQQMIEKMGLHFNPDGAMLAAGYGIDIIGQVCWGHAYYDKSGDVSTHQTRTGFVPLQGLAVILMGNSQVPEAHASFYLDHYRSYLLGIFLDIPKHILDIEFKKWRDVDVLTSLMENAPLCGVRFWKDPPTAVLTRKENEAFVGTYVAVTSPQFNPKIIISNIAVGPVYSYHFEAGTVSTTLTYVGSLSVKDPVKVFIGRPETAMPIAILAARNETDGQFTLNIGFDYRKE